MTGRILVVDDVATNRIILKAKLAINCYDVIQAASGPQALAAARAARPDLILLDLAMPGMSGIEVCERLKADPDTASIPVVVVTSYSDTRSKLAALKAGAEDFLTKPVDDMVLSARVRSILRARVLAEELELREGTRRALGFSEAPAAYVPPRGAARLTEVASAGRSAADRPARIALLAPDGAAAAAWRSGLAAHLDHRIDVMSRSEVLQLAREAAFFGESVEDAAVEAPVELPEVFLIGTDLDQPGGGLMLLSELRASPATRHAAILMVLPGGLEAGGSAAPMAYDLGASDLLTGPVEPEEMALRVSTQLARARTTNAMRRRLRDGLQLAVTDPLTGLYNRRYALSHLERLVSRSAARSRDFAVLVLDIDRFKAVNDEFGHAAGDAVLRAVASRLRDSVSSVDLVARFGGEEFLIVLPDTERCAALAIADDLRREVEAMAIPVPPPPLARGPQPERTLRQTVSIGVAVWPDRGAGASAAASDAEQAALLIDLADRALYGAKAAGRNRVHAHALPAPATAVSMAKAAAHSGGAGLDGDIVVPLQRQGAGGVHGSGRS